MKGSLTLPSDDCRCTLLSAGRCAAALQVVVLESEHPYPNNCDRVYDLHVPGARYLEIVFDDRSATRHHWDYVRFFADATLAVRLGAERYGRNHGNWPGVAGARPLIVKSDRFALHFCTGEHSNREWGWKLTA